MPRVAMPLWNRKLGARRCRVASIYGLVTVLVVASLSVVPVETAQASSATQAFDETAASALATSSGQRIEVTRLRTQTTQVFENPDGSTTVEQYQAPVRIRRGDDWLPVDPTLVSDGRGMVVPRAAADDVAFSGGGDAPLTSVQRNGVRLTTSWPAPLPTPVLDGSTATYRGVFPGVDLVMTSNASGFTQHLVVASAEASHAPGLRSLHLGMRVVGGGRLISRPTGGFDVVDLSGDTVWSSPTALMWDSSAPFPAASQSSVTPRLRAAATADIAAAPQADPDLDDGDQVRPVRETMSGDELTLTADAGLLDSPKTQYPVVIDPMVSAGATAWTMVDKTYPTTGYGSYADADQGVGYNNFEGVHTKRLFYTFKTSTFAKKAISGATLSLYETFSATCAAGSVDAYLTGGISSSTTWNNQPAKSTYMSSTSVKAGRSDCSPNGKLVELPVTKGISTVAGVSGATATFGLYGHSETSVSSWMRFAGPKNGTVQHTPKLSVTYNSTPNVPSTSTMYAPDKSVTCGTTTGTRKVFNQTSSTANLIARGSDPDGGTITVGFYIYDAGGQLRSSINGGEKAGTTASGADFTVKVPTTLADGDYYWEARTSDTHLVSALSKPCYIRLDHTKPTLPTITSQTYASDVLAPTMPDVGVFTLSGKDATKFYYSWNGAAPTALPLNTTANGLPAWTGNMRVVGGPVSMLTVYSVDQAGNRSDLSPPFVVKRAVGGALADYRFNEATADDATPAVALDTADPNSQLSSADAPHYAFDLDSQSVGRGRGRWDLAGCWTQSATTWVWSCSSQENSSLEFDGAGDQASVSQRPVASESSFTVGAWVRLDDDTASRTVIAQNLLTAPPDGVSADSAWDLGYDAAAGRFVFHVRDAAGTVHSAFDALPGQVTLEDGSTAALERAGYWVYLAGIYDSSTQTIKLDSAHELLTDPPAQPSADVDIYPGDATGIGSGGTAAGKGDFRIGDGATGTSPWNGAVDNVALWQQVLSDGAAANDVYVNANLKR